MDFHIFYTKEEVLPFKLAKNVFVKKLSNDDIANRIVAAVTAAGVPIST